MVPQQLDERSPAFLRHIIEDHPVAPLLGLKHRPALFRAGSVGLDEAAFFAALRRDPVAFLRPVVAEVRAGAGVYTAAVAMGLSVRLWPGRRTSQVWDHTRADVVSPPPHFTRKRAVWDDAADAARYAYSAAQPPLNREGTTASLYLPDSPAAAQPDDAQPGGGGQRRRRRRLRSGAGPRPPKQPWGAVVVVEERSAGAAESLVGSPRSFCHVATHEVVFTGRAADSAPVLVLRVCDCRHRSDQPTAEKKEILGGVTGSSLADLIAVRTQSRLPSVLPPAP